MNVNYFIFNMLDSIEWFAMLTLSLTLFRMKPSRFWRHNAMLALAVKFETLIVKTAPLGRYLVIMQLLLIALAFFLFYRIRFDYACIIAVTGGILVFVSVLAVNYAVAGLLDFGFVNALHNTGNMTVYALTSGLLIPWTFFMAWVVKRLRFGFSFVSSSYRQPQRHSMLFGVSLSLFLAIVLMLPPSAIGSYFPLLLGGVLVCLAMLLIASYRADLQDEPERGLESDSKIKRNI